MLPSDTDIIDEDVLEKVSNMIGINAKVVKVPVDNYKDKDM